MLDRNRTLLRRCCKSAAVALSVCLVPPANSGWLPACQADENAGLSESADSAEASDTDADASMVVVSDANTPARLEPAETAASQPISPRPLMCCRPSHPAMPVRRADPKVHPTLAALAEAVRPRQASPIDAARSTAAPAPAGRMQSAQRKSWPVSLNGPVSRNKPVSRNMSAAEFLQPQPLPNDSRPTPAPIGPPADRRAAAENKPLTISNPWAAAKIVAEQEPAAQAHSAQEPASQQDSVHNAMHEDAVQERAAHQDAARAEARAPGAVEPPRSLAPPSASDAPAFRSAEASVWRSRDPETVRLARYHRPEAQATARISPASEIEKTPAPKRFIEERPAGENPLRNRDAASQSRTGVWSSAIANPLR